MSKMSDLAIEKMQEAVDKGEYIPEPYEPDEEEYHRIMQTEEYHKEHMNQALKVAQADMKNNYCVNCGSKLGLDCGDAEPDYDDYFCSRGCYEIRLLNSIKV